MKRATTVGWRRMRSSKRLLLVRRIAIQLTLVMVLATCIVYFLNCIQTYSSVMLFEDDGVMTQVISSSRHFTAISSTTLYSRQRPTQRRWSSVDKLTSPTDVDHSTDQYSYYSARLSRPSQRHALDEMKFLRRGQSVAAAPYGQVVSGVNAIVHHDGASGLTSLSSAVTDNRPFPAPAGPADTVMGLVSAVGRQSQSAVAVPQRRHIENAQSSKSTENIEQSVNTDIENGEKTKMKVCRLPDDVNCASTHHLNRIPRILHQTSDNVNVPTQVSTWMRSWNVHNPSLDTWFWTDSALRHLLDQYFSEWLVQLYDSYPLPINRADLRKYVLLYAVGGLVADLDVECLRPISPLLDWLEVQQSGCVVSEEPELHREFLYPSASQPYVGTAVIGCRPRHPFIRFVLRLLPLYANNAHLATWNDNVLNSTGPTFFSDAVRLYKAQHKSDDVLVAASRWLTPTFDPLHSVHFHTMCLLLGLRSRVRPAGCDNVLHNKPYNDSYATHHWLHSWSEDFMPGPLVHVINITRITRLFT